MARTGMGNLIQRVRGLSDAGTADYTAGTVTYFSNDHIQEILDGNATFLIDTPLTWLPQNIGGTISYLVAQVVYKDLEEAESGTARWAIRTGAGALIGTASYSTDYRAGRVTFTSSQGGSAYYLTAYSYDVYQAAADLWRHRLADFASWYDFSYLYGTFKRSEAFDRARAMIDELEEQAGSNEVDTGGGDVRMSQFVRTDIAYSSEGWAGGE